MFRIAAITGGMNVPSAIYRIRAAVEYLRLNGIVLTEFCSRVGKFPPEVRSLRPLWLIGALIEGASLIRRVKGFDATILQRELISTIPSLEVAIPGRKILDVDDAIYLRRGGIAARLIAEVCIGVVCGNEVLAERFGRWNRNIAIIPTGVDVVRVVPRSDRLTDGARIIGWIGSVGNLRLLDLIADSIISVMKEMDRVEFRIVSGHPGAIPEKLKPYARFIKWYEGIEAVEVPSWRLGIMPLVDDEWCRGKCAFKALQCFAAGVPVVVSPVGMCKSLVEKGEVGYAARSTGEWSEAMLDLLSNDNRNEVMGMNGRRLVEAKYSLSTIAGMWKEVLRSWL